VGRENLSMASLEVLDDENYLEFLREGTRVLILTQKDCPHCRAWIEEVSKFLEADEDWSDVRFAKIDLSCGKVEEFKKSSDWLEFIPGVPFNVIFLQGAPSNSFAGSGVKRLVKRLKRLSR